MSTLHAFLLGALAMVSVVASVFFLRFWRSTSDRLFLFFAAAFFTLTLEWAALAVVDLHAETRPYVYVVRLCAFALIIVGIVDKNRRRSA